MVEQTVNESGRDARGSCLSSANVWISSNLFFPILSSSAKLDSQGIWLNTLVTGSVVSLLLRWWPTVSCEFSTIPLTLLTLVIAVNRNQKVKKQNALISVKLKYVISDNFFTFRIWVHGHTYSSPDSGGMPYCKHEDPTSESLIFIVPYVCPMIVSNCLYKLLWSVLGAFHNHMSLHKVI